MLPFRYPPLHGRTREQVWNHYLVESEIAARLKSADHEERKTLYATMYDELFDRVPDHPRLTRRASHTRTAKANRGKMSLLAHAITPESTVLEFAPGDCCFARELASHVRQVIGVDISDQRAPDEAWPDNLRLIVYDGYTLRGVERESVDVIFSDQLLEHLHPEDAVKHLALARSLLREGGCYVIRTPHAISGPWDVSRHFCDHPEGFHLKEWTVHEMRRTLLDQGFSRVECWWGLRTLQLKLPPSYFEATESALQNVPRKLSQQLAHLLLRSVTCIAYR